MIDLDPFYWYL